MRKCENYLFKEKQIFTKMKKKNRDRKIKKEATREKRKLNTKQISNQHESLLIKMYFNLDFS